jgi:nuclear transport factor 2 (NTF2) superfamily protein
MIPALDVEHAARNWAATWSTAWPRKDTESIAALYAKDAPYRALAFREPDEASDYLRRTFADETDIECRFGEPVVAGDRAAVEWWASWIEDARPITLAGMTLIRFDGEGKVVDHRDYWNEAPGRIDPYSGW